MALTPLATKADLALYMQTAEGALPAGADLALSIASDLVREAARNDFQRATSTVILYPDEGGWVTLPGRPVVSVASVQADGEALSDIQRRRDKVYVGRRTKEATVTYTHGYAIVPGIARAVTLAAASRILTNPSDLRQQTVGGLNVTFATETVGAALSQKETDDLARFRGASGTVSFR